MFVLLLQKLQYEVQVWEAANPEVKFTGEASGLSLEVGDLDPATTYVFRARVRGREQWSATRN